MTQRKKDSVLVEFVLRSIVIGAGATAIYDIWGRLLVGLGLPGSNWTMAGRWFSYMAQGQFTHANITAVPAVHYETLVGWGMHYLIGIVYAGVLLAIFGIGWARRPTLLPALVVGFVPIAAGWFIMAPAMGFGFASSKAPNVDTIRIVQIIGHCVFGLGLYLCARVASMFGILGGQRQDSGSRVERADDCDELQEKMMHEFKYTGEWFGDYDGHGVISCGSLSAVVSRPLSMHGPGKGTNPDELLVSAAGSCFLMSLTYILQQAEIDVAKVEINSVGKFEASDTSVRFKELEHYAQIILARELDKQDEVIAKAIEQADERCMVSFALRPTVKISVVPNVRVLRR
ncbi:DUF2938 family protein [Achromobacter xylosoxidans]|uniref:DUF2938 family protein n=1 Tax=Alcaligenes xylosoxydans xylosoxydans TaxID=85698 RepID=UPI001F12BB02|nr:DUF2938 family protein [Achromobacter xylosoxidans]